jgi:microcompartment protein CcmK/EutM
MSKLSFVKTVVRSGARPVHFIVCKDSVGRTAHYFIMCSGEKLRMVTSKKTGVVDLAHYGKVLAAGYGREPTRQTIASLREEYGIDLCQFE